MNKAREVFKMLGVRKYGPPAGQQWPQTAYVLYENETFTCIAHNGKRKRLGQFQSDRALIEIEKGKWIEIEP